MIQKIFNKQVTSISVAALILGAASLISRLLGIIRDRIFASQFGAGDVLDVYYAAFRLPDFLYISIASLASVTVLLPFLAARMKEGDDQSRPNHNINQNTRTEGSAYNLCLAPIALDRMLGGVFNQAGGITHFFHDIVTGINTGATGDALPTRPLACPNSRPSPQPMCTT